MVGLFCSERVEGKPLDDWVAVFDFPESKEITRLVSNDAPDPDGCQPICLHGVSYNEVSGSLACAAFRDYSFANGTRDPRYPYGRYTYDVWICNVRTTQRKWIGWKRWGGISHLAWSGDGQKLAFLATETQITLQPRQAEVFVFDLRSETLTKVADDGLVSYSPGETGAPVWGEDGQWLYYASIDRRATRIELATGRKERSLVPASHLVTVRGDEIVYRYRTHPEAGMIGEEVVYRTKWNGAALIPLYRGISLQETLVSPSRRFVLAIDRRSYCWVEYVLIDLETGTTHPGMGRYFPKRVPLVPRTTVFCGR